MWGPFLPVSHLSILGTLVISGDKLAHSLEQQLRDALTSDLLTAFLEESWWMPCAGVHWAGTVLGSFGI